MPRKNHFSEEIRDAINGSGRTHYKICQEIGLVQSAMSKFMTGRAGLSLAVIDRIADLLDLHVVAGKPDSPASHPKPSPKKRA